MSDFYSDVTTFEELEMKRTIANETDGSFLKHCVKIENSHCFPLENETVWFDDKGKQVDVDYFASGDLVESIPTKCFDEFRHRLKVFEIPESVKLIDMYAFENCRELKSLTIPHSVTDIGTGAFCNCSSLSSIKITETLRSLGDYAFSGCSKLISVELPDSLRVLGESVFEQCLELKSVVLPPDILRIPVHAFSICSSLETIKIPETVRAIHSGAFEYDVSSRNITIPKSVRYIAKDAFDHCPNLILTFENRTMDEIRAMHGYPFGLNLEVRISKSNT